MNKSLPNLVFVHGFLSGKAYWFKQQDLSKYCNLFYVELPGFGDRVNVQSQQSIAELANTALAQIESAGIKNFDLIGHSMGGMIAQEMVNIKSDVINKLILYGTGPFGDMPGRFESIQTSLANLEKRQFSDEIKKAVASWFLNKEQHEDFNQSFELAKTVSLETYKNGLFAMNNWSNKACLKKIKQQTLIVWGDKDRSYIFDQPHTLWKEIPNSHLAVVPNSAHNTHLEKPAIFNQLVLDFIL